MACEPAASIIKRMGGPIKVAELTGISRMAVYKWTAEKERSGTGGTIPLKYWQTLIDAAARIKVRLKAEDFVP